MRPREASWDVHYDAFDGAGLRLRQAHAVDPSPNESRGLLVLERSTLLPEGHQSANSGAGDTTTKAGR
jgi:hypothetical protein